MVLSQLRDGEVLGSFRTEGQGLYPLQHILGKSQLEQKKGRTAASVQTEVGRYGTEASWKTEG